VREEPFAPKGWRAAHPVELALLCASLLLVSLQAKTTASAALVLLVVSAGALLGGVPWSQWCRLLVAPIVFVAMSTIPFALSSAPSPSPGMAALPFSWSTAGAHHGLVVGTRALAASSCLLLFAARTPLHVVTLLLRRVRVPSLFADALLLTGRLVAVTRARFEARQRAAALRMGAATWMARWRTSGLLGATLLVDVMQQARRLEIGLDARGGFTTDLVVTPSWGRASVVHLVGAVLLAATLWLLVVQMDGIRG
jgi:cobalt/nickel transport system permease protein